jgi:predicted SnoaL-like aldol condensation-catalyzing enzyme
MAPFTIKGDYMRCRLHLPLATALLVGSVSLQAQEPVVGASDPEALFHSSDPTLNTNKQAAYHIVKDLLEAGHWELADKYLTERYIQHNPNAASGRAGVVKFFTEVMKVKPVPVPEKMRTKVVSVVAGGDLVMVAYVHEVKDAKDPARSYTTTWFDMWRFKDGKADEHWDPATRIAAP